MPQDPVPYLALVPYAAVALGLVITLVLFLSVKVELERTTRRERKRVDEIMERLQAASPMQPASAPEPVFVPIAASAGLNINRRTHALRLLRKGQDIAHVSAALGVPRQEIELLVRVQDLIANTQAKAAIRGTV